MRLRSLQRVAALFLLLLCGAAWADPPGRAGWLAETRGTVWMVDGTQGEWVAAERNRPLTGGDRLATDHEARAELRIGSTTVRLGPDTDLSVQRLDDERIVLQLNAGALTARVRSPEGASEFEVDTAEGRFLPQRNGHYRIDRDREASSAGAMSGELRFDAEDSTLVVPQGQRAEFWREGGVTHYTWSSFPADALAEWSRADDRREPAPRYVSPEMTGGESLDRYGQWDTHPEYGPVWIPMQVSAGWAPYRYGHWAWVNPWGWSWVDDAPWGFAPFHYGRWSWWHNRWCWVPGAYVARPVYAPALVGWVGGPSVSVNITVGSGPLVGWVPLAPREVYYPPYALPPHHWRQLNPHVPDRFYRPGQPPQGPIMYTNRGVPGGITVVASDVLKRRAPVAPVMKPVDPQQARQWVQPAPQVHAAPPPPARVARPVMPVPPVGAVAPPRPVVTAPPAPVVATPNPGSHRGEGEGRGGDAHEGRRGRPPVTAAPPVQAEMPRPAPPQRTVPVTVAEPREPRPIPSPAEAAARPLPVQEQQPRPRHEPGRPPHMPPSAPPGMPPVLPAAQPAPPPQQAQPAPQPQAQPAPQPQRDEGEGRRQRPRDPREGGGPNPRTQVQ